MDAPQNTPPPFVWWAVWGGITSAFFVSYGIFEVVQPVSAIPLPLAAIAFVPMAGSAVCRFLLLPRAATPQKAFVLFIVGLALAEAGGFIGVILGADRKAIYGAAAIVLMIAHVPAFVNRGGQAGKP